MSLRKLRQAYRNSKTILEIDSFFSKEGNNVVHIDNPTGSSLAFLIDALHKEGGFHQLIIARDKEAAAYIFSDLREIAEKENILFFPDSYKRAYELEETDNANVLKRAEVLKNLSDSKHPQIIVTYPEAIYEKVVSKKTLKQQEFPISVGENYSQDFLIEVFNDFHFERVDFVVQPGEFSIRGSIIDVFPFTHRLPYRIDFFGDEVEEIRDFDPVSQLSTTSYKKMGILPNLKKTFQTEDRVSIFKYMGNNTITWIEDADAATVVMKKRFAQAKEQFEKLHEHSPLKDSKPEYLFYSKETFLKEISNIKRVEFGLQKLFSAGFKAVKNILPQPKFNKNFQLFSEDILQKQQQGYKTIVAVEGEKQEARLHQILEDINVDVLLNTELSGIHEGFIDNEIKWACYTDHQIYGRYHKYKIDDTDKKRQQTISLKELRALTPGDFVTHIDYGIGRFSGLEKIDVLGKKKEAIRIIYANNDILYVSIHSLHEISKYTGKEGREPKLDKMGGTRWKKAKQKAKTRVKTIAYDLIKVYAERKASKGFQYSPDSYLQHELEASFIYEDTPDQLQATIDVKKDMEAFYPMDRLICGDVGFGKTEVAIRAAFKAVTDNKQVAILVPTTILAFQHYKTFKERLNEFPVTVDFINRFKSSKQQKETLERLSQGKVDIIIGTHRIVGKDVKFSNLGLLVIDEEQKFGVGVKDKLKTIKANVDVLTLTATPIPRTLQFSLMSARDLSVINTPPPNRSPIDTVVTPFNEETIRDAVSYEYTRGGQVFFINNRVENIHEVAGMIQRLCPDVKVLVAHGQMAGDELEKRMMDFMDGKYDVLVATTIIESGIDIPNANTIIINNANHFGLSDLHQMRGRVGRSNKKAFCYLFAPQMHLLTSDARKRLEAISQFSELGSGFHIAMRDLDIRGAGDILGADQSGFIGDIGFETYKKILQEAVEELKETEFKELYVEELKNKSYVSDCQIETDLEIMIPDNYITNIGERLHIYRTINQLQTPEETALYKQQLLDRFGPLPEATEALFELLTIKDMAKKLGFQKLVYQGQKLIGYFVSNQQSSYYSSPIFSGILKYVQAHGNACQLKERKEKLTLVYKKIDNLSEIKRMLQDLMPETYEATH